MAISPAGMTEVPAGQGVSLTPVQTKFNAAQTALGGGTNNAYFTPSYSDSTNTAQTSQPDIMSMVNSLMQQLTGRFATPEEIQYLGGKLLAAEAANPSHSSGSVTYQDTGIGFGKKGQTTNASTNVGVDPQSFLTSLIQGTADARSYGAASKYFDLMQQSDNKFRSAFSG